MPGTPIHIGERKTEEVRIGIIGYDKDTYTQTDIRRVEEIVPYKEKPNIIWINIDGLHETSNVERLGELFDIHPLVVEDILNTEQHPKIDFFDDYVFLVLKMNAYNAESKTIDSEQVSIVFGDNFVLTFQEQPGDVLDGVRNRLKNNKGRIRKLGADYLAYSIIDTVVDHYFTVLEGVGEEIENLEEELVSNPARETLQKIHVLKREMIFLRRSVWPLREVISSMQREESSLIKESTSIYLRDLYDHTIQVADTIETYRDMISGMLDIYLSSMSNRMNEVMKVLTIFAVIFIPLTFIAGIYGMNFNTDKSPFNMPELNWFYGYPFALGIMAAVAIGMVWYFIRKKWL